MRAVAVSGHGGCYLLRCCGRSLRCSDRRAVLAGLAAAAAVIIPVLRAWFGPDNARAQLVEQRVAILGWHCRLPLVLGVRPDQLRVHVARVPVPFIKRDQQHKLAEAVRRGQATLVVRHSMSGKDLRELFDGELSQTAS